MENVTIVGGGLSGLAAAHHLRRLRPSTHVQLLEASSSVGGISGTEYIDGFVIERGADSIIRDKPWAWELVQELSLESERIFPRVQNQGVYVVCRGKLERIPPGFSLLAPTRIRSFIRSPILSWAGRLRAVGDLVLPRGGSADESVAEFVKRRFGEELFEALAQPLASGIYGAEPERLSLNAALPRFAAVESEYRSVIWGLRRRQQRGLEQQSTGVRYGAFFNFRRGTQTLVDALERQLEGHVQTNARVVRLARRGSGWVVQTPTEEIVSEGVILAIPAWRAAALLEETEPSASRSLSAIPYGSAVVITLAWPTSAIPHALDAFGFVVPRREERPLLACTWSSRKWEGRAPAGMELLRVFVGGRQHADLSRQSDDELVALARGELRGLLGIEAEPVLRRVQRWPDSMPHYLVGHRERVSRVESQLAGLSGLEVAGNGYHGVGIPDAVRSGQYAVQRLLRGTRG